MVLAGSSVTEACVAVRFGHRIASNDFSADGQARGENSQLATSLTIIPEGRTHEDENGNVRSGRHGTVSLDRSDDRSNHGTRETDGSTNDDVDRWRTLHLCE
jgi:hypothetical protein